jgi:hypothetical protein
VQTPRLGDFLVKMFEHHPSDDPELKGFEITFSRPSTVVDDVLRQLVLSQSMPRRRPNSATILPRQPSRDRKKVRLSNPLEVDVANSIVHTEADLSVISVTRPFTKLTVVWIGFWEVLGSFQISYLRCAKWPSQIMHDVILVTELCTSSVCQN